MNVLRQLLKKNLIKLIGLIEGISLFKISLLVVLLYAGNVHGQPPEVKEAFHYIEIEQPSRAAKLLNELTNTGKKTPNVQYYIGLGYVRLGQLDVALKAFEEGISLKEKYGLNYAGKAHVLILQGKSDEAEPLLQRALELSRRKDAEVLTAVAAAYVAGPSMAARAIHLLDKAKGLDTKNRETYMLLGDAYLALNRGGESVSNYEWAAKADQSWALPHFKIALVYNRTKNYSLVFESLNKAISIDNLFGPAYRKLGELYYIRKEAAKAVDAYERYLAITENPGDARYQYAFFLIMARQFDKANKIFEEVIHSDDVPPLALKYYAFSLLEQDTARRNAEQARPLLERYMAQLKPDEIQAADHAYYGKLLLKLNEDSLASQSFAKSLALDSTQQDVLTIHAKTLMQNRRFEDAAAAYEKIVQLDESPSLQDLWNLGQAYYFDEQYVNADSAFNRILRKQSIDKLPFQVLLFSARSKANIDSTMSVGLAKPMYEAFLERISKSPSKYNREAVEGYTYLGAYYVHKEENFAKAKACYEKILELDSANSTAKEFMKAIAEPQKKKDG
jgi:tetratricopeptide (TPR) repeat protein